MKTTIHVTQKHIETGVPGSCTECPIALAFKDSGFREILVGGTVFYTRLDPAKPLPVEASRFAGQFDAGMPVHPFSFTLDL